jgi:hypothetical protein
LPIGVVAALTYLAMGFVAVWRSERHWRRDWSWLALPIVLGAGIALAVVRDGIRPVVITGPLGAAVVVTALLIGSLAWAQALGLPRPLALLLGIGLTSRRLAFSNHLRAIVNELAASNNQAIDDPSRRPAAVMIGEKRIAELRSIRPPDTDWGLLRDELADAYQGTIDFLRADVPRERFAEHAEGWRTVMARWTDLAERAVHDQRSVATPVRRRRGRAIWLATFGISFVLIGAAELVARDMPVIALDNPAIWLPLANLAVGGAVLVAALVVAVRRAEP